MTLGALDPKNRRNLALRAASAAVLFPLAVWLTVLGGKPFAFLAAAGAAVAAGELILMFGTIGLGEVFGIAVAGAIPLMAAFGEKLRHQPSAFDIVGGDAARWRGWHVAVE